jgi:uncharacterized cupredoxin-like copper-binding protein
MRKLLAPVAGVLAAVLLCPAGAIAGGDLSKQDPITVRMDLLVLHNPSNSKHYFTSLGMGSKVWTRKVQVMDDLGPGAKQIGEIKGAIREIEVYPGGTTEWFFVPVATGTVEMSCGIKDQDGKTHAENGMHGTITIF